MTVWTLAELAAVLGGRLVGAGDVAVRAVSTDSRDIEPGDLFVALVGPRFDGHGFAAAALEHGAAAVVVNRAADVEVAPRIEVDDTLVALRDLAARRRRELSMSVVAVTGSSGKTTTKDLLAAALPGAHASGRSFNNEIGVPLTVLGCPDDASFLVLEVGSRGPGHIAYLADVVRPDVSIVTNIGTAHLETFVSRDRLAAAKGELIEMLGPDGTAVLPVAETSLRSLAPGRILTFGDDPSADVAVDGIELDDVGAPTFTLRTPAGTTSLRLQLAGAHQALNAAAATAAGLALGVGLDVLAAGLESATGSPLRMQVHPGRFTVIDDSYNANPESVAAALRTTVSVPGRHLAVLGEMAELGPASQDEHVRIGRMVRDLGFAALVVVGNDPGLVEGAGSIARPVIDASSAAAVVTGMIRDGDVVLVKASRSVGLDDVARRLVMEAGA